MNPVTAHEMYMMLRGSFSLMADWIVSRSDCISELSLET